MKESKYDIAYKYLRDYAKVFDCTNKEKKDLIKDIEDILDMGYTCSEIYEEIKKIKNVELEIKKYFVRKKDRKNLLEQGRIYYHQELRITPGPPKRILDYNTGDIKKLNEDYFMEIRGSYSIEDLYEYYCKQHREKPNEVKKKRHEGALHFMLIKNNIDLDELLFAIDIAANVIKSEDLGSLENPFELEGYINEAKKVLNEKMTEERIAGDDKIVPRKRIPLDRMRSIT